MHQQNKQKWLNMAGLSIFQSGPKGSKTVRNGKPRCFWPFGTLMGPSGPFWTTSNEKWYSLKSTSAEPNFVLMGQQIDFCLKWPKSVWKGPKESQIVKNIYVRHFGLLWTTLECWQAWHVWTFVIVLSVRFWDTLYSLTRSSAAKIKWQFGTFSEIHLCNENFGAVL